MQSQLYFYRCSLLQSRGCVTKSGELCSTLLRSNLCRSIQLATNQTDWCLRQGSRKGKLPTIMNNFHKSDVFQSSRPDNDLYRSQQAGVGGRTAAGGELKFTFIQKLQTVERQDDRQNHLSGVRTIAILRETHIVSMCRVKCLLAQLYPTQLSEIISLDYFPNEVSYLEICIFPIICQMQKRKLLPGDIFIVIFINLFIFKIQD